ncbi:MAG: hypothetical protein ACRD7E_26485 [Bryobacteraceae bacterium]
MDFRATNFTVTVLLLMAVTAFMVVVRYQKPLENNWPLVYWISLVFFTLFRREETFDVNIILVGLVSGLLLRFEFMNNFLIGMTRFVELMIWGYVLYRGFVIVT